MVHYVNGSGENKVIVLVGYSEGHAREEASYEIKEEYQVIGHAVRGEFLYEE